MEKFQQEIVNRLQEHYGEEAEIITHEVVKNNDCKYHAVSALLDGIDIGVNLYMEEFYEEYQSGTSMDAIIKHMIKIIEGMREKSYINEKNLIEAMSNYPYMRENIIIRLLNREHNEEYLENKVYVPFLDLAAVVFVMMNQDENGISTLAIPRKTFEEWNIPIADVFKDALEETIKRFPAVTESFQKMLTELEMDVGKMLQDDFAEMMNPPIQEEMKNIFIITNKAKINGAAVLLYPNVLKELAEQLRSDKLYILPSSIHELIVLDECDSIEQLQKMVHHVNQSMVLETERLSDNVYIYDNKEQSITIAK